MDYSRKALQRLCLKGVITTSQYFMYRKMARDNWKPILKRRFRLEIYTPTECKDFFRFTEDEIDRLQKVFRIPKVCIDKYRQKFTGKEGLCILLRRLAYPNRLCELEKMFYRHKSALSRIFNWMLHFIFNRAGHLMTSLNHAWLNETDLKDFAEVMSAAGSWYPNVVGFIDGTARPICRPKYHQELQYSGYKKVHVVKYQSVVFPNGLIGRLDGPINGRRHDAAILCITRLLSELEQKFVCTDGTWYALYGDPGYANQKFIKVGFKNRKTLNEAQKQFNADMSALRVHVEYGFGKVLQNFAFLDFKKNQKLLLQPLKQMYIVSALLTNCITCLRGNQVSDYFGFLPPTLEEYVK